MKATQPISYREIDITGGFWKEQQARSRAVTMPAVLARFRETGRFDAARCEPHWPEGKKPHFFWDSDLAKWLESAAYLLQKEPDPVLEQAAEELIAHIEASQWADGYYNIYFTAVEPKGRWQNRDHHELYCAGHLIEAAVAYYEATGRRRLLDCMLKYAAHIEKTFMTDGAAAFETPGHEELELALVKLWRCTGDARWLRLSQWFVERRGRCAGETAAMPDWQRPSYNQSHLPVREQRSAEGHAVRALYLYCAMADLAMESGDAGLRAACEALFENITEKRMYITGGIGSSHCGEAFTMDYDLPNETAYSETCAAIALALFCRRMSALEPDARYADTAERAIYNGVLSGVSEDGAAFFYENPLELRPALRRKDASVTRGERFPLTRRQRMFSCACCPPNLTRLVASFGDFLFTRDETTLYVHHYAGAKSEQIEMTTEYPRDGLVRLRLRGMAGRQAALRVPGWCESYHCDKPGSAVRGYYYIHVDSADFTVTLRLDMPPRLIYANPLLCGNIGRAAVTRGPVVYCLESVDNGENLRALSIPAKASFSGDFDALECDGHRLEGASGALYSPKPPKTLPQRLRFLPYHRFANRGECEMAVWLRVS
ncbi:MAG: glycoside hydrolase family 127 protein [Oscillospiraceae bacterium]|nr:glycoside hydrolase family 127 protein [Oscillospiraceae bacterium]